MTGALFVAQRVNIRGVVDLNISVFLKLVLFFVLVVRVCFSTYFLNFNMYQVYDSNQVWIGARWCVYQHYHLVFWVCL